MKPTVLLVHGAWHNGAGFAALQTELAKHGFESQAVELSSVGTADQALGDMFQDAAIVRAAIASIGGPCVVLGHSYGGLAITQGVAGSTNVQRLIYMTAFMLDEGETLYAACGSVDPDWWNVAADKTRLTANTPEKIFYNTCPPEVAVAGVSQLRTQSLPAFNQPITEVAWKEIPSTYIICEQDNAIPVFAQEAMSGRATNVVRINTDHSPFLSSPAELADLIKTAIEA
jgi:pimeloyl-ACP methyl ester carboxylesterase